MFEVRVFNKNTNQIFSREFNNRKEALNFARKVKYSEVLCLLAVIDNSKFQD